VKVIKLIAKGTIEERIHEYAQHKLQLEKEMTKNGSSLRNNSIASSNSYSSGCQPHLCFCCRWRHRPCDSYIRLPGDLRLDQSAHSTDL